MRNQRLTSFLLSFLFLNNAAFADVVIKGKASENITFYSGSTKTGQIDNTGTLTLPAGKTVENVGGGTPPGMVPVGGMVAVMPAVDTTNAWQPPATGVIKDGFMRADGAVVPSGQGSPLQGRTLPNMQTGNRYPRGSTATSWVTGTYSTGGANTQASNVSLSSHSVTQPVINSHTVTQPTFNVPGHHHAMGTGADLNITASGGHTHGISSGNVFQGNPGAFSWYIGPGTVVVSSNETHTHASVAFSGRIGLVTGGSDGNAAFGATRTTDVAVSAHSLSTNVGVGNHTVTNNAVNNEPAYVEVVWVIRVK